MTGPNYTALNRGVPLQRLYNAVGLSDDETENLHTVEVIAVEDHEYLEIDSRMEDSYSAGVHITVDWQGEDYWLPWDSLPVIISLLTHALNDHAAARIQGPPVVDTVRGRKGSPPSAKK